VAPPADRFFCFRPDTPNFCTEKAMEKSDNVSNSLYGMCLTGDFVTQSASSHENETPRHCLEAKFVPYVLECTGPRVG